MFDRSIAARLGVVLLVGWLAAVGTSSQNAWAADKADEQRLKDAMIRYSTAVIDILESEVKKTKQRRAAGQIGAQPHAQDVRFLQEKIRLFRSEPLQVPRLCLWRLQVGDIGRLTGNLESPPDPETNHFRVLQVVDESNMLITSHGNEVLSMEDQLLGLVPSAFPYVNKSVEAVVWVTGIRTAGITDGTYTKLGQVFEVSGTKKYETAIGASKTVFVISPFSIQDTNSFAAKIRGYEQSGKKSREAPNSKTELRTWKDATGNFTIRAKFGGIIGGKVVLVKQDGSKVSVTREQLSKADNEYLDDMAKK